MRTPKAAVQVGVMVTSLVWMVTGGAVARASDHSDIPTGPAGARPDANLTDLHAFVAGSNLVLSLSTNQAIPASVSSYVWPTDVTFELNIDVDAAVAASDPFGDGGTILDPDRIREDLSFRIRFRPDGSIQLHRIVHGAVQGDPQVVSFFAGLRDDPFIRGPRIGRNVAAIVLEVPLYTVLSGQSTLLLWATSKVNEFEGPFQDLAGRSLRSMFPEQNVLDSLHPKQHFKKTGLRPDVMIFDTALPAAYPNGRALGDDVADLACALSGECRVLASDTPFPSANDVPFLSSFPYLAPPQ